MLKLSMMTPMKRLRVKNDPQMMSGTYLFLEHVEVVNHDTNEEVESEERPTDDVGDQPLS